MFEKIKWVDCLKGFAMCAVIMIHTGGGALPGFFGAVGRIGQNGVQLFFLISGYLTFVSLEHAAQRKKPLTLFHWYCRKLITLGPIYYLSLVVGFFITKGSFYWLGSELYITKANLFTHMAFLHGLVPHYCNSIQAVEWYLGALFLFYLIAPLLFLLIRSLFSSAVAFLIAAYACPIIISKVSRMLPAASEDLYIYQNYIYNFWLIAQLPVILLGVVLYFYLKTPHYSKLKGCKPLSVALFALSMLLLGLLAVDRFSIPHLNPATVFGLCFLLLALSQAYESLPPIVNPVFSIIGKYSYPIYLFHYTFSNYYERLIPQFTSVYWVYWLIRYVVIIGLSLLFAIALTKFFDRPMQLFAGFVLDSIEKLLRFPVTYSDR